jgi:hypothetical protein
VYMVNECYNNPDFQSNDVAGFAIMFAIFSVVFFSIRAYRKQQGGLLTFGEAFKTGLGIVLVAATLYVVVWLFYYYLFVPDFMDKYVGHIVRETSQNNPEELQAKAAEMENFRELYKSPLMVIMITYAEVVPLGLVVALISASVLKKNE